MEMEREIERKIRREKGRVKYRENSHRKKKLIVREKWHLTMFFYIYKFFWSFLHDFNLLNPNPLSARRKSLSNFV